MSNETRSENKYAVDMACLNCGCKRVMSFPCGKEVPRRVDCPNCGCYTMTRTLTTTSSTGVWNSRSAECMDVFFNGRKAK